MKTLSIVVVFIFGFVAGQIVPILPVLADWTEGENQKFFERVASAAQLLSDAEIVSTKLAQIADDENIGTDPLFIDVPPWTKAEVLAIKPVFEDLGVFMDGSATLPAVNRRAAVNAMLLGLQ